MIVVRIRRDGREITVQGHAQAKKNEQGHDLVCCAVSTLTQAAAYAVEKLGLCMAWEIGNGYWRMGMTQQEPTAQQRTLMGAVEAGMEMLSQAYPQHIRVDQV